MTTARSETERALLSIPPPFRPGVLFRREWQPPPMKQSATGHLTLSTIPKSNCKRMKMRRKDTQRGCRLARGTAASRSRFMSRPLKTTSCTVPASGEPPRRSFWLHPPSRSPSRAEEIQKPSCPASSSSDTLSPTQPGSPWAAGASGRPVGCRKVGQVGKYAAKSDVSAWTAI